MASLDVTRCHSNCCLAIFVCGNVFGCRHILSKLVLSFWRNQVQPIKPPPNTNIGQQKHKNTNNDDHVPPLNKKQNENDNVTVHRTTTIQKKNSKHDQHATKSWTQKQTEKTNMTSAQPKPNTNIEQQKHNNYKQQKMKATTYTKHETQPAVHRKTTI